MTLEFSRSFGILLGYFIVCVAGAFTVRRFLPVPSEVFRKTLHIMVVGSVLVFTYAFSTWQAALVSAVLLAVGLYPVLALAEGLPGFSKLLIQRKPGEIKRSLLAVFTMLAVLIAVCWGHLGEKYLIVASVFAWGFGDAAAALVGKRFGRRYIQGKLVEGRKTLEGTAAMFAASFLAVLAVLLVYRAVSWYSYVPVAAAVAAVSAVVELYTRDGMDTMTCPLAAALVLIVFIRILGV
ncbi:MAG: phosphatidate cytidylyltransferase [Firmicutes bacterium]|jgi:dolichol kinase|nr:phosphatidate cytidylyltransferase [Bacillota bacterium]HQD40825.1 phosphatidate cytidylyltransferase [Bacillota bacterium]